MSAYDAYLKSITTQFDKIMTLTPLRVGLHGNVEVTEDYLVHAGNPKGITSIPLAGKLYLDSLPLTKFRTRPENYCTYCFMGYRDMANVVAFNDDGELITIFDNYDDVGEPYRTTMIKMREHVLSYELEGYFLSDTARLGIPQNTEPATGIVFKHVHGRVPDEYVSDKVSTDLNKLRTRRANKVRLLDEANTESLETVVKLFEDDDIELYQKAAKLPLVRNTIKFFNEFNATKHTEKFLWEHKDYVPKHDDSVMLLAKNLYSGMDVSVAVDKYNAMTDPMFYKEQQALALSAKQEKEAKDFLKDNLFWAGIPARHCTEHDIKESEVIFASQELTLKDEGDALLDSFAVKKKPIKVAKGATELAMDAFVSMISSTSPEKIEVMLESKHVNQLMTLTTQENTIGRSLYPWGPVMWTYKDGLSDVSSLKARIKSKGYVVDAPFNIRLSFPNTKSDYDAILVKGSRKLTYSTGKVKRGDDYVRGTFGWYLDQDTNGLDESDFVDATENIFSDTPPDGEYVYQVKNYTNIQKDEGVYVEFEAMGEIYCWEHPEIADHITVDMFSFVIKDGKLASVKTLKGKEVAQKGVAPKEVFGLMTEQYHEVTMVCTSPNNWVKPAKGDLHYFFIMKGAMNPDPVKRLHAQYLDPVLLPHKKYLTNVAKQVDSAPADQQLSGLGFNTERRFDVNVKVDGRPFTIKI